MNSINLMLRMLPFVLLSAIVFVFSIVVITGISLFRKYVNMNRLRVYNEVTGYVSAIPDSFYGLMLGIAVFLAWGFTEQYTNK